MLVDRTLGFEAKKEKGILLNSLKITFRPNNDISFFVGWGDHVLLRSARP